MFHLNEEIQFKNEKIHKLHQELQISNVHNERLVEIVENLKNKITEYE